jgi:glycosyltransferase involved in cell wall biosynthesis
VLSERGLLIRNRLTWKKKLMLWSKRLLYAQADMITAVSQGVKDDLIEKLHLSADKIMVVYNPIVTSDLPQLADEPVNHPWFAEDVPVILGVGRLVEEKDFPTLIRAFALVRAQRPCRLLILGEGHGREELEHLAQELGIQADVDLPGFDKNPFKYMARCTVFVLSSRFEGLPGVLIQAMACGTAVISTDCPSGPSEIITAGRDGLLVPVADGAALADCLNELLANPQQRAVMGQRARLSAQRFCVQDVLAQYTAALTKSKHTICKHSKLV